MNISPLPSRRSMVAPPGLSNAGSTTQSPRTGAGQPAPDAGRSVVNKWLSSAIAPLLHLGQKSGTQQHPAQQTNMALSQAANTADNGCHTFWGRIKNFFGKIFLTHYDACYAPAPWTDTPKPGAKADTAMSTVGMDKVWDKGYTGKGVGIAVIDTGIYPHPDLKDRIVAFHDVTTDQDTAPFDDEGHGTHVAGDAAGSGKMSDGYYRGAAPDANLIGLKVADGNGGIQTSNIIKAIQWAVQNKDKYNIKVINMSLGGPAWGSSKDDPVAQAVEQATKAGIVVVVAAGNDGPKSKTVATPGIAPSAITVGNVDDRQTANRADDSVDEWSSRGPTRDGLTKPDVAAPGVFITAPLAPGSGTDKSIDGSPFGRRVNKDYVAISGTSMASPIVAGLVANLLQANPKLTPAQIKAILIKTSTPVPDHFIPNSPELEIDAAAALDLALKS